MYQIDLFQVPIVAIIIISHKPIIYRHLYTDKSKRTSTMPALNLIPDKAQIRTPRQRGIPILSGSDYVYLVPKTGLEPVRCCHRGILSPGRLPNPPLRHGTPQNYRFREIRYNFGPLSPEARVFHWRRHPDLNRGIRVLQTRALPLGYGAIFAQHIFTICPSNHFYPPG